MDRCSEPGRSGHRTDERNRDRIGHCFCGELEFGLWRERSRLIPVFDSQVVRQDPEKAIVWGAICGCVGAAGSIPRSPSKPSCSCEGATAKATGPAGSCCWAFTGSAHRSTTGAVAQKSFLIGASSKVGHSANTAKSRRWTVLLQSVTLARRTGWDVLPKPPGREPPNRSKTVATKSDAKRAARSPSLRLHVGGGAGGCRAKEFSVQGSALFAVWLRSVK